MPKFIETNSMHQLFGFPAEAAGDLGDLRAEYAQYASAEGDSECEEEVQS